MEPLTLQKRTTSLEITVLRPGEEDIMVPRIQHIWLLGYNIYVTATAPSTVK